MNDRRSDAHARLNGAVPPGPQVRSGDVTSGLPGFGRQHEWFEVTLASIGDAVITVDGAGRVTYLNPAAEAMTAWRAEDARGLPLEQVFRIVNEVTGAPAENPVQKVLQLGHVVGLANHTVLISRDGRHIPIEDSAAPIRDGGRISGVVMVFHDVTERRRAQEALRDARARLELTLATAEIGTWSWNPASERLVGDRHLARLFSLSPEEAVEGRLQSYLQAVHPDDRDRVQQVVTLAVRGEPGSHEMDFRVLRPDGALRWLVARTTVERGGGGMPDQLLGVMIDITDRKHDEEARARLAAVVASSDDAIVSKTLEGVITSWNYGAERMFGYTPEETIGRPVLMLIPPSHQHEEPVILDRLKRGERIDHYETVRRRKDGTLFDVSLTVSPVKDDAGRIIGASKIARDITQRKRAEEALRDEARILQLLHDIGPAIAGQLDLQALVQTVTDAATQLSGAAFGAFFYNVLDERGETHTLYTLSGASREAFGKLELPRNTPLFEPTFRGGAIVRSDDVTRDTRYGGMEPLLGTPPGHLPLRSYLAAPVLSRSGDVIGGLFFGHSRSGMFSERAERLVAGVAAQAGIALDNARLYESAQREIAQRERVEAALRETDRRKDEFLATLAHELRNPLAPIRQAALISKAPGATEAQKRWSHDVISRQVHHMALLLDDLLDVSRITRGTLALRLEMTELAAVIDAAVEQARPAIDAKRHALSIETPPAPLHFAADPLRLAQLLSNLLTNAAKYTDAQGGIGVRAWVDGGNLCISVTDNGVGIPEEAMEQVFEMFSQVKSSQDHSDGGLGIGLALAKGLAELHGGTLSAHSNGIGQGSEFTVTLPLRTLGAPSRPRETDAPLVPAGGRRVLIADDNRDAAESLAMLLEMDGHVVAAVHDGRAALEAFEQLRPELVLLDIGMPGLSGYDVARQLRGSPVGRGAVLVAVTGWGQERDKAEAASAGFDHHLTKPIDFARLQELLRAEPGKG